MACRFAIAIGIVGRIAILPLPANRVRQMRDRQLLLRSIGDILVQFFFQYSFQGRGPES